MPLTVLAPTTAEVRPRAGLVRWSAALAYGVAAAVVMPLFAIEVWSGFRLALPNDVLAIFAPTEQPLSVRSPGGQWAAGVALLWLVIAYWRRNATWWEGALVVLGTTAALIRTGNLWLDGLLLIAPLGRQLSSLRVRIPFLVVAAATGLIVTAATAWSTRPPELPPAAIAAAQSAHGTVFADWQWAPELQRHVESRVLAANGLASESPGFWNDYVRITHDFEQWPDQLRALDVDLVVIDTDLPGFSDDIRSSPDWRVLYDADHALVAQRVGV